MAIIPFRKNEQKKLYVIDKKIETTKTNNDLEYYDNNYEDSGLLVYDRETQNVFSGGSGCGCVSIAVGGYVVNQMKQVKIKKVHDYIIDST